MHNSSVAMANIDSISLAGFVHLFTVCFAVVFQIFMRRCSI